MKRLPLLAYAVFWIALFGLLILAAYQMAAQSFTQTEAFKGAAVQRAAAATLSCRATNTSPQLDQTERNDYLEVGGGASSYYVGQVMTNLPSTTNACSVGFFLANLAGNVSTKTFRAAIWSLSGANLDSELVGADITGINPGGWTWVLLSFAAKEELSAGGNVAFTLTMSEVDGSNKDAIGVNTTSVMDGYASLWGSDKVNTGNYWAYDLSLKVWFAE